MKMRNKGIDASTRQLGFTIVELLIVIVVLGILAAIMVTAYNGIQNRANDTAVQSDLRQTYGKIRQFYAINDRWPSSQAEINETFVVTRKSYGGGNNRVIYCRSNDEFAVVGRSLSGTGFYYSSAGGGQKMATWPGDGNANLCPAAGIPTSSPGYVSTWIYVNGAWESWFTPGS